MDSNEKQVDYSLSAQRGRLLALLKKHPVTTFQARNEHSIAHPGGRVCELRKLGVPIEMEMVKRLNAAGEIRPCAMYFIKDDVA